MRAYGWDLEPVDITSPVQDGSACLPQMPRGQLGVREVSALADVKVTYQCFGQPWMRMGFFDLREHFWVITSCPTLIRQRRCHAWKFTWTSIISALWEVFSTIFIILKGLINHPLKSGIQLLLSVQVRQFQSLGRGKQGKEDKQVKTLFIVQ